MRRVAHSFSRQACAGRRAARAQTMGGGRARTATTLLLGLAALLQPAARSQTCQEWNCTDPGYHMQRRFKDLPTVYPLAQVGGSPVYVNGTATNATTDVSFVPTVPAVTDACEEKGVLDPVDCVCGCRAANRMVIYTLAYLHYAPPIDPLFSRTNPQFPSVVAAEALNLRRWRCV